MSASAAPMPLREVRGPSAFGGGTRRFFQLLWLTSLTDIRLRYRGSVLGYAWTLLRPLALFGILYLVFTRVIRFGGEIDNYAVLLLLGIVLFSFFADSTTSAVGSVVAREGLVRRTQFPRIVIPLSTVLTASFTLFMNLVAVAIFMVASGVDPRWSWLLLPLVLVALAALSAGASLLLSAAYVRIRDTQQAWAVLSRALFYASPILYPVEFAIDAGLRVLFILNPLAPLLAQARVWLLDPDAPGAVDAVGGAGWLAIPIAIAIGISALGLWGFTRVADRIAEDL